MTSLATLATLTTLIITVIVQDLDLRHCTTLGKCFMPVKKTVPSIGASAQRLTFTRARDS
jgi:hypothetical protein